MVERQQDEEERVVTFLDGSNFYHRLKGSELGFKQLLKTNMIRQLWLVLILI